MTNGSKQHSASGSDNNSGIKEGSKAKTSEEENSLTLNINTMLPAELKILIFSFLSLQNLAQAQQACILWNSLAKHNSIWQLFNRKDFSYLEHTQKDAFDNNSRDLYLQEFNRYKKEYTFPTKYLLDTLKGDFSRIEKSTSLNVENLQVLYSFAVSNGHYAALKKVAHPGRRPLRCAAQTGRLDVVKHIFETKPDISTEDKGWALVYAAQFGRLSI